jgi:hypothetical protein
MFPHSLYAIEYEEGEMLTHDHKEIKKWAEKHQGKPELIDHNDSRGDAVGIRINFPGDADDLLLSDASPPKEITWNEFFEIFDGRGLAIEFEDKKSLKDPAFSYRFLNRKE